MIYVTYKTQTSLVENIRQEASTPKDISQVWLYLTLLVTRFPCLWWTCLQIRDVSNMFYTQCVVAGLKNDPMVSSYFKESLSEKDPKYEKLEQYCFNS